MKLHKAYSTVKSIVESLNDNGEISWEANMQDLFQTVPDENIGYFTTKRKAGMLELTIKINVDEDDEDDVE